MTHIPQILLALLALAMVLASLRLIRGPSLPDRVVALDLLAAIGVAMAGIYSQAHDQPVFLNISILLALISFVGTVAFACYIEKKMER